MTKTMSGIFLSLFMLSVLMADAAFGALTAVGKNSARHGFPLWYQDSTGLKLEMCLVKNLKKCLEQEGVNTRRPIKFPTNFPGEAFWFSAETEVETSNGGSVLLVMAIEAAFANDVVRARDRVAFNRLRIRGFDLPVGRYRITHPYGVNTFDVLGGEGRVINFTDDVGIQNNVFTGALAGQIGPFLRWDPVVPPLAPAGYIGDPSVPHKFIGSPIGTNFLRVEKIDGGVVDEVAFTDELNIAGNIRTTKEDEKEFEEEMTAE